MISRTRERILVASPERTRRAAVSLSRNGAPPVSRRCALTTRVSVPLGQEIQPERSPAETDFDKPVLIMTGSLDDWTPVGDCQRLAPSDGSIPPTVSVYEGVYHSFDSDHMPRFYVEGVAGTEIVEGNPAAAAHSRQEYLEFLDASLRVSPGS